MPLPSTKITNRDVSWPLTVNSREVTIHGTITKSAPCSINETRPRAAVILVAGGGPTDRDWCSPQHPGSNGSGRLLAETLASHGYVTLRYEKFAYRLLLGRVPSEERGAKISMESSWRELIGAVELIRGEYCPADKEAVKIFLFGNSEGALHAVNYQLEASKKVIYPIESRLDKEESVIKLQNAQGLTPIDGLILSGTPGEPASTVAETIMKKLVYVSPVNETSQLDWDELRPAALRALRRLFHDEAIDPSDEAVLPPNLVGFIKAIITPESSTLMREQWDYNPGEKISKLCSTNTPVLVVVSKKDAQLDWKTNTPPLESVLAKAKQTGRAEILYAKGANHVLKHEEEDEFPAGDATAHYNDKGRQLDEEVVEGVLRWLGKY